MVGLWQSWLEIGRIQSNLTSASELQGRVPKRSALLTQWTLIQSLLAATFPSVIVIGSSGC